MKIYKKISELIGNTPILKLSGYEKEIGALANVFAKLEYFNPAGSVKDRAAFFMLNDAEKRGVINKDTVIIEPTSGNTGIAIAMICSSRGYKTLLTMPDTMSDERKKLLRAYGAELVLTDGALGMKGAIDKARELNEKHKNSFIVGQFENEANVLAHYETTGPEIYRDLEGNIDVFVAGVGTGGTISGIARYLKEKNPNVEIIAVEPHDAPFLSHGVGGNHKIQGIGAGFCPKILERSLIDEIYTVKTEEAYSAAKLLRQSDGVFVGISSGAALHVASLLAKSVEYKNKNIVVLFPDGGEKYLSVDGFIS
jgi:cysteine synthase A